MNKLLKLVCLLFLIGTCPFSVKGQNDSIFPNFETDYHLLRMSYDEGLNNWVLYPTSVYLWNFEMDDTVEVEYPPIAKIFFDEYKVYIQEVSNGGFMYTYPDSAVVLYDFGLEIGDTAYWEHNSGSGNQTEPVIVEDVYYTTISGHQLKKMELSNSDVWVQGIGSLTHPFWPVMSHFEINFIFCEVYAMYTDFVDISDGIYYQDTDCSTFSTIGLNEQALPQKQLLRTVDLLGREIHAPTNQLMIRIFSDGSTEKIYVHD